MPDSLRSLMADARQPSGDPAHSGGVEAACVAGLIRDLQSLRDFLYGRLWTAGAVGAFAAAAVCARATAGHSPRSLWKGVEAEVDARIPSPAARRASRVQGGALLRRAMAIEESSLFDGLARSTVASGQQPHHPVALGAVAALAGASPGEAAEAAAYASVAGPAFAARSLLGLDDRTIADLGVEMAPEVERLARESAEMCLRPMSQMPSTAAPALEYLAEVHDRLRGRAFAS